MKSTAKQVPGCYQSVVDDGRNHGIVIDLPEAKKGEDVGPTALELAGMALSGCIATIWAVVAANSGVGYDKLEVELEADKPDDAPTFTAARAKLHITSDEPDQKLQRTLDKTMRACPVGRLFEQANIEVKAEIVRV
jgi:putative redox protein